MNNPANQLHASGQSLWLDSMSRNLLRSGTLSRYIKSFSISGLTFNQGAFSLALEQEDTYDASIRLLNTAGFSAEDIFYELVLEDIAEAAVLFRPIYDSTNGRDGWVSLEVSPLLNNNTLHIVQAATKLFAKAAKANLLVAIIATSEGLRAAEELVYSGIPVNFSLLFSSEHYLAAGEAYMRGLERRIATGLSPVVESVASLCVSPWDANIDLELASPLHHRLAITMATRTYHTHCELMHSERWQKLAAAGARPQRLLWSRTGVNDAAINDTLYIQSLVASGTINAMPAATLLAFAGHGRIGAPMPADGGYAEAVLDEFRREGIDETRLAVCLQRKSIEDATSSWYTTLTTIREKSSQEISSSTCA